LSVETKFYYREVVGENVKREKRSRNIIILPCTTESREEGAIVRVREIRRFYALTDVDLLITNAAIENIGLYRGDRNGIINAYGTYNLLY